MVRITKAFKFEMAHALHGYDGLCKNIHGHSYRLWVTIRGEIKNEKGHRKDGRKGQPERKESFLLFLLRGILV